MMRTAVWGCGRKLKEIMESFVGLLDCVDFLIDSRADSFMGREVSRPDILSGIEDCQVVICVYSQRQREEILEMITSEFKVSPMNVITENQWLIEVLSTHENVFIRPTSVCLEASTLCQLNCVSCGMRLDNYGNLGAGYLKFFDFKHFIDNNSYIKNIELSNYVEVFLNPELKEIIHYAGIKGIQLTMDSGVNFNDVDDEVIEEMIKSGAVHSMLVSIDGASQEVYQKYRRNGNLYQVLENIKKLNAAKKKFGSKYPILRWQYVLFEHNENEVGRAKELAASLGMDIAFKLDWTRKEWVPKDRNKLEELTGMKQFNRIEYEKSTGNPYLVNSICRRMIFQPQINYDGRLLGCCTVRHSDWQQNVFEAGLLPAINSKGYKDAILVLLGKEELQREDTPCAKCAHKGSIVL